MKLINLGPYGQDWRKDVISNDKLLIIIYQIKNCVYSIQFLKSLKYYVRLQQHQVIAPKICDVSEICDILRNFIFVICDKALEVETKIIKKN